jgi:hypothetical protein
MSFKPEVTFTLQAWLEFFVSNNHNIILGLDANEDYTQTPKQYHPLTYTPGKHIISSSHDGSLATLITTCGLIDPATIHHSMKPPPTYARGSKRIDYIFISKALQQSNIRSGILPDNHPFNGDHRPCFLDFEGNSLFQEPTHSIDPPRRRGLQLSDPRKVRQYLDVIDNQLEYHKILTKKEKLQKTALNKYWIGANTKQ